MASGCGKHAGTNSIYCPSHNAVYENMGFAPSTVVWPCFSATWHSYHFWFKIFSHYIITDSAASSYKKVQKFERSSAVAQSCEFIQFAIDDDDQNLSFLDALTQSMDWVILQTFYRVGPHSKLWKWMSYKFLATFTSAISLHFLWG